MKDLVDSSSRSSPGSLTRLSVASENAQTRRHLRDHPPHPPTFQYQEADLGLMRQELSWLQQQEQRRLQQHLHPATSSLAHTLYSQLRKPAAIFSTPNKYNNYNRNYNNNNNNLAPQYNEQISQKEVFSYQEALGHSSEFQPYFPNYSQYQGAAVAASREEVASPGAPRVHTSRPPSPAPAPSPAPNPAPAPAIVLPSDPESWDKFLDTKTVVAGVDIVQYKPQTRF